MAQLTIYLDEETHRAVEAAAKAKGCSLSRWARGHLREAASSKGFPEGFFDLFGSVTDASFREPAELDQASDGDRLPL